MEKMLEAVFFMLLLGLGMGTLLAAASRLFYVWEDPKILAIKEALPGANCGGCGEAGCGAAAEAIAAGRVPCNVCVVGGFEVARDVGEIMGQKILAREPEFAWSSCRYGLGEAEMIFEYDGALDCRAAVLLYGGSKECPIGCIGLGSCVRACRFSALTIGEHHLPVVNTNRCVGCGACARTCPQGIISLTSSAQRFISEYTIDECTAPCQRICPTGINIPAYILAIQKGDDEQALRIIKEKCPLPSICGYICPAPCELQCRRGRIDESIAINSLKRFAANRSMAAGWTASLSRSPDNGQRVALIGGGAEGLSAAYYLALLGYRPTIFEAGEQLGGILRYVISPDRLPRRVLEHDIEEILRTGVEAKTNTVMGRDFHATELLREGYDAVVLTLGGMDSRKILHPAQRQFYPPVPGTMIMLDVLMALARGTAVDLGEHVVIVQSGEKALALADQCRNRGVEKITLISHRPTDRLPDALQDTHTLRNSGVKVLPARIITALGGHGDRLRRVVLEHSGPSGVAMHREEIQDVDALILSAGRFPEFVFVCPADDFTSETDRNEWQTLETFRTFPHGSLGILGTPEPGRVSDSTAVVKSILSARRLVRAVHQHFTTDEIIPGSNLACEAEAVLDVDELVGVPATEREQTAAADMEGVGEQTWIFPRELPGLDEASARKEAARCLQCGLICYLKLFEEKNEREPVQ